MKAVQTHAQLTHYPCHISVVGENNGYLQVSIACGDQSMSTQSTVNGKFYEICIYSCFVSDERTEHYMRKNRSSTGDNVIAFPVRRRMRQGHWFFIIGALGAAIMAITGGLAVDAAHNGLLRLILGLVWIGLTAIFEYVLWLMWLAILGQSARSLRRNHNQRIRTRNLYNVRKSGRGRSYPSNRVKH